MKNLILVLVFAFSVKAQADGAVYMSFEEVQKIFVEAGVPTTQDLTLEKKSYDWKLAGEFIPGSAPSVVDPNGLVAYVSVQGIPGERIACWRDRLFLFAPSPHSQPAIYKAEFSYNLTKYPVSVFGRCSATGIHRPIMWDLSKGTVGMEFAIPFINYFVSYSGSQVVLFHEIGPRGTEMRSYRSYSCRYAKDLRLIVCHVKPILDPFERDNYFSDPQISYLQKERFELYTPGKGLEE